MRAHAQVQSVLLCTPSALCHVDFEAPLPSKARARRRRARIKPPEDLGTAGSNFRVLPLENPCLLAAFTAPGAALLVSYISTSCCSLRVCYSTSERGLYGRSRDGVGVPCQMLHAAAGL
jgi:hypothetical protein